MPFLFALSVSDIQDRQEYALISHAAPCHYGKQGCFNLQQSVGDSTLSLPSTSLKLMRLIPSVPTMTAISMLAPFAYRNRQAVAMPRVMNFFRALRESTELPIAAAGFCWGGQCK